MRQCNWRSLRASGFSVGVCLALSTILLVFKIEKVSALPVGGQPDVRRLFKTQLDKPDERINLGLAYWIELLRDGKIHRLSNKFAFRSGDAIRIHMIPNTDGYAYILLKSGSRGDRAILFPNPESGVDNRVERGRDYALPTEVRLKFDNNPGTELLTLVLSRKPIDINQYLKARGETAFVSSGHAGSKDLVPTRIQLGWDEPAPVLLPQEVASELADKAGGKEASEARSARADSSATSPEDGGMVTLIHENPDEVLSVDIALEHRM